MLPLLMQVLLPSLPRVLLSPLLVLPLRILLALLLPPLPVPPLLLRVPLGCQHRVRAMQDSLRLKGREKPLGPSCSPSA